MAKQIHVVFQVLNFIAANPKLTPSEKLLLIFLARHKGEKGIFPSIETLANELSLTARPIQKTLRKLEKNNLLKVIHRPSKSNLYELIINNSITDKIIINHSTPVVDDTPALQCTPVVDDTPGVSFGTQRGVVRDTIYNPVSNPLNKREEPLSSSNIFKGLTVEHQKLAKERGLSAEEMKNNYLKYCRDNEKRPTDWGMLSWIKNERIEKVSREVDEMKSRVPEYGPGHPTWEAKKKWELEESARRFKASL